MKPSFYIFMALCVVIFASLGTWQVQRLSWKNALQEGLDVALAIETPQNFTATDIDLLPSQKFLRRSITAKISFDKMIKWRGQIEDGKPVFYAVAPLEIEGEYLPLILGFSDDENLKIKPIAKAQKLNLLLKENRSNIFRPANNLENAEFYRLNSSELTEFWGKKTLNAQAYLVENAPKFEGLNPVFLQTKLPNNHLNYAVFWFSLAFLVFGLSLFLALQRRFKSV